MNSLELIGRALREPMNEAERFGTIRDAKDALPDGHPARAYLESALKLTGAHKLVAEKLEAAEAILTK